MVLFFFFGCLFFFYEKFMLESKGTTLQKTWVDLT